MNGPVELVIRARRRFDFWRSKRAMAAGYMRMAADDLRLAQGFEASAFEVLREYEMVPAVEANGNCTRACWNFVVRGAA